MRIYRLQLNLDNILTERFFTNQTDALIAVGKTIDRHKWQKLYEFGVSPNSVRSCDKWAMWRHGDDTCKLDSVLVESDT